MASFDKRYTSSAGSIEPHAASIDDLYSMSHALLLGSCSTHALKIEIQLPATYVGIGETAHLLLCS